MLLEIGAATAVVCAVTACLFIRGATRKREPDGEEPGQLRSLSVPGGLAYGGYQPLASVGCPPPRPIRRKKASDETASEAARFVDCQGWVNVYETYHGNVQIGGCYRTPGRADEVAKPHRKCRAFVRWDGKR